MTDTTDRDDETVTDVTVDEATSAAQTDEHAETDPQATDNADDAHDAQTFPRSVVERLRKENATYRTRAMDRDSLAERLHTALVAATGRLADPTDLPYDDAHLTDATALEVALSELLERKPHLGDRRPRGDIGQGARGGSDEVDLAGMLRGLAG